MMWWEMQGVNSLFPPLSLCHPARPVLRAISRCVFIKECHVLTHPSSRFYVIEQLYYFRLFTFWMEGRSFATDGDLGWGGGKDNLKQ